MGTIRRRQLFAGGIALAALAVLPTQALALKADSHAKARMRIIIDNDLGGDPDGLFQLTHFALSPSVAIPLIVGSQYKDFGPADLAPEKAELSAAKVRELLKFIPARNGTPAIAGSNRPLQSRSDALDSAASSAIVREALLDNSDQPLFYAAGGSLTEIARAWLADNRIGSRLRLVWIGGAEHPDLAGPPPGPGEAEYNFSLDRLAAHIIFNESDIEIWQVPRNAFRQMLIGLSELERLARTGPLGQYLHREVIQSHQRLEGHIPRFIYNQGETITLGDTALVTLTALQSAFQPDSASSDYTVRPTPVLLDDGSYQANPKGRPMRIYNRIDANLTFRDMMAKIEMA